MQREHGIKQEPKTCEWCGKFIVVVSFGSFGEESNRKAFEFFFDEKGRLVKNENELYLISREHKCRVTCFGCGKLVILENERLYERTPDSLVMQPQRIVHNCKSA